MNYNHILFREINKPYMYFIIFNFIFHMIEYIDSMSMLQTPQKYKKENVNVINNIRIIFNPYMQRITDTYIP